MIKSLSLTNWKSFGTSTLWIDSLTFIIGTNSAGKSNIVDALAFLAYIADGNKISDISVRGGIEGLIRRNEKDASLRIVLLEDRDEYTYDISVTAEGKELLLKGERLSMKSEDGKETTLFFTENPEYGSTHITAYFQKSKKSLTKGLPVRRDTAIICQVANLNVIKEIKEVCKIVANSLNSIFVLDPKPEKMRGYTPLSDTLSSDCANIAGVIAGLPEDKKKTFEETLTDYVRPLPEKDLIRIWAEPIGLFKTDAMLYCAEEWIDGEVIEFDARSMSDGTLRFIAIITALLSAKKGSTLVIEEVDNGLHPSRAGELVMALKQLSAEKGIDIICTTHNPVLIDALGPEMLPFISYVSRSECTGASEINLLEDTPHLLKLLANYTPGGLMTKGYLKATDNEK